MPVINILSPHLADMIAAGEVVERPASVVKELVENALDAGARNITVEIRGGGATYIRVTDDGCGMAPEDAGIAFLRHATSKLKDEHGLECISTMGFRGEALAAISAVSRVELRTRRAQDQEGCLVQLEAGEIQDMGFCGCPVGTVMTIRDLFFNTPARLKFLKSDRSEGAACEQTALRCALGHPEVSVRFLRDGKEVFFSPGDSRPESCIYSLLGRDLAASFLPCFSEDEGGMRVNGFISSPAAAKGNRSAQYFYCNGRYIRSPLMQAAVEQAYKNTLLGGRFPACVLYLRLGHSNVDVNVHPAKTEVKFSSEKKVFDLIYQAVVLALETERPGVSASFSTPVKTAAPRAVFPAPSKESVSVPPVIKPVPKEDFFQSMRAEDFRANGFSANGGRASGAPASLAQETSPFEKKPQGTPKASDFSAVVAMKSPQFPYEAAKPSDLSEDQPSQMELFDHSDRNPPDFPERPVENSVQSVEKAPAAFRYIGEALKTYIMVEQEDTLILIDKHAAHERIVFDRLKAQKHSILAQTLLAPVTVSLEAEDALLLEENQGLLDELGFSVEPFGGHSFVVRTVPADLDIGETAAAIEEICDKLRLGKTLGASDTRDEILHTVACKAAIKAGWDSHRQELETLVTQVLSGKVKYCPHGRPVAVRISRRDLDKQFKRII